MSKIKFKDLGYAALGATIALLFPSLDQRLEDEIVYKRIQEFFAKQIKKEKQLRKKGEILDRVHEATEVLRSTCNHRKGGMLGTLIPLSVYHNGWSPDLKFTNSEPNGLTRWEGKWVGENEYLMGRGDSPQYAVIKHVYHNRDMHVRCLRCAKTWKPGDEGYDEAVNFPTLNVTSTSLEFKGATEKDEVAFQERYRGSLGNRHS